MGNFETQVLLAVLRKGDDAYGVSIGKELELRTGKRASSGAVYTTLERLRSKGYLKTRAGEPTPDRGGRRKQYYRVTGEGRAALEDSLNDIAGLSYGVKALRGARA